MKRKGLLALLLTGSLFLTPNVFAAYRDDYEASLQDKNIGKVSGEYYLASVPETIIWGRLPNKNTKSILTVPSGSTITIDTLSHEGMLEDQGKDPIAYFGQYGVEEKDILSDAVAICRSKGHNFDQDGPHIVTGPIKVEGAMPGDVLKVEVLALQPRVPYGVISNRHYKGALPGEFPENKGREEGASSARPDLYHNVSVFTPIKEVEGIWYGYMKTGGKEVKFPIAPFLGIMGVTPNTEESWSSVPPANIGGNVDVNELGIGSTVYLPVEVPGAMFFAGDPHFVQGDGEVALTALEGSLRATLRLTVLKKNSKSIPGDSKEFDSVFGETEKYWIPIGLDQDLDEAMKKAVRRSIDFVSKQLGMKRDLVYAYLSAATDYEVSQVVDKTKGIHALISKVDFIDLLQVNLKSGSKVIKTCVHEGVFYAPAEEIIGSLSGKYDFNAADKTLLLTVNNHQIKAALDSNLYLVDGKQIRTQYAPLQQHGKVMLPVSALSEVLGLSVNWSTVGCTLEGQVTKL